MPTTPVYGWPYPAGTDRVMDGDNAIGALGAAIETTLQPTVDGLKRAVPVARSLSADQALTNAQTNLAGTAYNWTAVVPETVLLIASFDIQISAADTGIVTCLILVDGAAVAFGRLYFGPTGTGRATVVAIAVAAVAAGARTAVLQGAKANSTGTVSALATGTRLAVIRIPT